MAETATDTEGVGVTCTECGCSIDWCSFCDEEDCAAACCYDCMTVDLLQATSGRSRT